MSNRAKQIEVLLAGMRDPLTDRPLDGGIIEFYESGTSTPKNAYTDSGLTTAVTTETLDSDGRKLLYGEGNYKILIKNSSGVLKYTFDPVRVEQPNTSVVSKTTSYNMNANDDIILVDTGLGDVTITFIPASDVVHPVSVLKTSSDANNVILDPNGSETINGSATISFSAQNANYRIASNGANLFAFGAFSANAQEAVNSNTVDYIHANASPTADTLLPLDGSGKYPNSVLNTGHGNGLDADTLDTYEAGNSSGNVPISNGVENVNLNAHYWGGINSHVAAGGTQLSAKIGPVSINLSSVYVKKASVNCPFGGVVTTSFDLRTSNGSNTAFATIYINGVAAGTPRGTLSVTPVTYVEDMAVSPGDSLELWLHAPASVGTADNFILYGDAFVNFNYTTVTF